MSYAVADALPPSVPVNTRRGASDESVRLDQAYVDALGPILSIVELRSRIERARAQFIALLGEYASPGWDGYDAMPVSADAVDRAFHFAVSLSPALSSADVSANAYGDVEFEWYVRPDKILTLSIGPGGRFFYAGLNGIDRYTGSGYIAGPPPRLLRDVRDVLSE